MEVASSKRKQLRPNLSADGEIPEDDFCKTPIHKLPDDCLIIIFSLLPRRVIDRVRIQRVCKRWEAVSQMTWSSYKTLTLTTYDWGNKICRLDAPLRYKILENVLKTCGRFIISVDLSGIDNSLSNKKKNKGTLWEGIKACKDLFEVIIECCPNISSMNLGACDVTEQCIDFLARNHTKLQEFSLSPEMYDPDVRLTLSLLFRRNRNLRKVKLLNADFEPDCWLRLNPEKIEELEFFVEKDVNILCTALENFVNLKTFIIHLDSKYYYNSLGNVNMMLEVLASHAIGLKELAITECSDIAHGYVYLGRFPTCISNFKNLEILRLSRKHKYHEHELFEAIGKNCTKLTHVHLEDLRTVTDLEMENITRLPQLQKLYISSLPCVSDMIFMNSSPALRELDLKCPWDSKMRTPGLRKLIQSSTNLEHIKLTGCDNVDIKILFEEAAKLTDFRSNGQFFRMSFKKSWSTCIKKRVTRVSQYFEFTEWIE